VSGTSNLYPVKDDKLLRQVVDYLADYRHTESI